MSELSGLELRKAVAEKIGWTEIQEPDEVRLFVSGQHPDGTRRYLPPWESDLNLVFKDVVPWILRNDDMLIEFRMVTPDKMKVFITRLKPSIELAARGYGTPAEAICRAVLKLEVKSEA